MYGGRLCGSYLLLAGESKSAGAAREFVREYIDYHVPGVAPEHLGNAVLIAYVWAEVTAS